MSTNDIILIIQKNIYEKNLLRKINYNLFLVLYILKISIDFRWKLKLNFRNNVLKISHILKLINQIKTILKNS